MLIAFGHTAAGMKKRLYPNAVPLTHATPEVRVRYVILSSDMSVRRKRHRTSRAAAGQCSRTWLGTAAQIIASGFDPSVSELCCDPDTGS